MDESEITKLGEQFIDDAERIADNSPIIKVVGVGGGGNNAINHMYGQGIKDVSFVVLNTDKDALRMSPVPTKVMIGTGLGAGNDPEVARQAAENDIEKIESIFNDKTEMVFVTAGMGGGTGTGAGPVVARVARERGLLTVGIVTIPFLFEGDKKIIKALQGAEEMAKYVDALLVINNERLAEIYGDLDFMNAFGKADDTLTTAASSISELITADGYINLDFRDVNSTLRNGGAAVISTGYGEGENRVRKAIEDALHSPLLKNCDVYSSKKLLFNLYFSRKAKNPFAMSEVNGFREFTSSISGVDVVWGVAFDDTLEDKVKITILATGFDVDLHEPHAAGQQGGGEMPARPRSGGSTEDEERKKIEKNYGHGINDAYANYLILSQEMMDDEDVIEMLEHNPTFNRERALTDKFKNLGGKSETSGNNTSNRGGSGMSGRVISWS